MVVSVLILGLWFMSWSTSPTWDLVASGLTPDQATEATEELESAGIEHRLVNGGTAIEVPSSASADAMVAVGEIGATGGAIEGYELLDRQGFMASSFRQRIDYQRAIEGELARTLMGMDGVTSATVHLAIPEERLFAEEEDLTRASVVVDGLVSQTTLASIASVVASAVPGLDASNVTVADTTGRILSGGSDGGMSQDQKLQMQDLYEAQLEMAADSMLGVALGPGRAVVRVTADLNFDELESETVTYVPDEQVTLREQTLDEAFTGDNTVPLGTLGTAEDVTDAGEIAGDSGSAYLRQEVNSEFGVPSTRTVSKQAPGSVERITVAVILDETLDPAPDPAVLSPLVAAAVGLDETRGDTIVVESIAFDASEVEGDEATDPLLAADAAAADGLEPIIGYAKTGAAILGMLLALLFLRKGLKGLQFEPVREAVELDPATVAELTKGDEAAAPSVGDAATSQTPALTTGESTSAVDDVSTVDMLELIDSQSDEVAHLLRDLVSEAS